MSSTSFGYALGLQPQPATTSRAASVAHHNCRARHGRRAVAFRGLGVLIAEHCTPVHLKRPEHDIAAAAATYVRQQPPVPRSAGCLGGTHIAASWAPHSRPRPIRDLDLIANPLDGRGINTTTRRQSDSAGSAEDAERGIPLSGRGPGVPTGLPFTPHPIPCVPTTAFEAVLLCQSGRNQISGSAADVPVRQALPPIYITTRERLLAAGHDHLGPVTQVQSA